jgi:hypothetical protein
MAIVQVDQQKGSYVGAFDLATGKTVWRTDRPDEISTWGTPTVVSGARGDELVTNGTRIRAYDPVTDAVKAGASGDISMPKGATSSAAIAWSNDREGTYIPTPLLYRDILYTLNSNGILIAYNATTGERVYVELAKHAMNEVIMATPAISDGLIVVRTLGHLYGLGEPAPKPPAR